MVLRFLIHGAIINPWRIVEDQANMMRYIIEETRIRIPKYYTYSMASDEFDSLGPFILIDFIPG
jgi:hypothetical protein